MEKWHLTDENNARKHTEHTHKPRLNIHAHRILPKHTYKHESTFKDTLSELPI